MSRKAQIGWLLVAASFVALVGYATLGERRFRCEVCMDHGGRTDCRVAGSDDRYEAIRTATDSACGMLSSDRADKMKCARTEPAQLNCTER
jgi:hypothetical protein